MHTVCVYHVQTQMRRTKTNITKGYDCLFLFWTASHTQRISGQVARAPCGPTVALIHFVSCDSLLCTHVVACGGREHDARTHARTWYAVQSPLPLLATLASPFAASIANEDRSVCSDANPMLSAIVPTANT